MKRAPHPPLRAQPGLLRRIFTDPQPVLDELRAVHGPVVEIGAGPVRLAIVGGPDHIRELFATPTDAFRWNHRFNVLGFVVGDSSMIVSDGHDHRRRRSSVQTAFSRRRLNGWIPMIVDTTDTVVDRLLVDHEGDAVNLYEVGRSLILEIVVRAFFGDRLADRAPQIGELFQSSQDYLESPAVRQLPHPLPFSRRARVRADRRAIDAIIDAEIAHHRAHPTGDPDDVLDTLVANDDLTDAEIRDQVVTLIGAGYDTTAAALAWTLWCSLLHGTAWSAMRDEADDVFGAVAAPSGPDHSTLNALVVADRVVRETLRLHPAGAISPREAAQNVTIGDIEVRKGTLILWSAHLAGRDPDTWPDPLSFEPDRFIDPDDTQRALAHHAWIPFGGGRRNCIGFALAQMELILIISRLAQRLDVELADTTEPRPVGMVVNRPLGGVPARVRARRDQQTS
jgi:cytochrome P450